MTKDQSQNHPTAKAILDTLVSISAIPDDTDHLRNLKGFSCGHFLNSFLKIVRPALGIGVFISLRGEEFHVYDIALTQVVADSPIFEVTGPDNSIYSDVTLDEISVID